jgi:hypothetical protein
MTDEMPAHRHRYHIHLRERFLYPVLANVRKPSRECGLYGFRTVGLGDSDDRDVLAVPSPLPRSVDSGPDSSDPIIQLRIKHSYQIYQSVWRETIFVTAAG